ncbi:MAG: hypothetical protein ACXVAY_20045 [Mucilaginibacter sp.]
MNFYFDYFFYRISKLFRKYNGDQGARAIVAIAFIESALVLSIVQGSLCLFFDREVLLLFLAYIEWVIVFVVSFLSIINYLLFKGRYKEFDERWKNESKFKKRIKGALILISSVIALIAYSDATSWIYHIGKYSQTTISQPLVNLLQLIRKQHLIK